MPLIDLEDLGRYARWIFENSEKSSGLDLRVATEQVGWEYLVKTFMEVTDKKAVYKDVTLDEFFALENFGDGHGKVGHLADFRDDTLQTHRQNFSGYWNMWMYSGGNVGVIRRDYKLLDEILPDRLKTVGEWMRKSGYKGQKGTTLKDLDDGARAKALKAQAEAQAASESK